MIPFNIVSIIILSSTNITSSCLCDQLTVANEPFECVVLVDDKGLEILELTVQYDPVAEITGRVYEELEVLRALDKPKSMIDLQQESDRTTTEVQDIVSRLGEKDAVTITNGQVERHSTTI
jgi:hypothetical protein